MPERKPSVAKKNGDRHWNQTTSFKTHIMTIHRPYFVLSCPCGCGRLDCPRSEERGQEAVRVVPIVNDDRDWQDMWAVAQ